MGCSKPEPSCAMHFWAKGAVYGYLEVGGYIVGSIPTPAGHFEG